MDSSPPPLEFAPISRKRARSPFDQPRRSISPDGRYGRRGRSLSPSRASGSSYVNHKYNGLLRYREQSPRYRRERSPPSPPRPSYRMGERAQRGLNISGANSIPLISPRSNGSRLSIDTSRVSSSPEIRTPNTRKEKGTKVSLDRVHHQLGGPKTVDLKPSEVCHHSFKVETLLTSFPGYIYSQYRACRIYFPSKAYRKLFAKIQTCQRLPGTTFYCIQARPPRNAATCTGWTIQYLGPD